jgi:sec-independent protein translocase protein TatC
MSQTEAEEEDIDSTRAPLVEHLIELRKRPDLHRAAGILLHPAQDRLFGALFISFPVIASQIYMFVAPGLYRNERQAFLPFLVATPILFRSAARWSISSSCPWPCGSSCRWSRWGRTWRGSQLLARVSEYLSLIMTLIFAFGICFQLPVILTLLGRVELRPRRG